VVKFSRKEHAITVSPHLKLGSSRYYREHQDATDGIGDPEEGRLVQRGSLSEVCKKNGSPAPAESDHVSSTMTWARSDFLMFCTSVAEGPGLGRLRKQFPKYDCATFIPDPSAFAMQLGKDIGKQFDMNNVRFTSVDNTIRRMVAAQAEIVTQGRLLRKRSDTTVLVSHGSVAYCDPPERIINRFPIERRGEVIPFVKRRKYGGQQEYRFVVEVIGEPTETEFLMEITDELRSLVGVAREKSPRGTW